MRKENNLALTKEEKRVATYAEVGQPTDPSKVTPDTPLACLNLNWSEKQLPEKERTKHVHRLHPYLGKFIPQLIEIFLRKYFAPGQTILDPFAGSCTALVQANELGINCIGYDVSAFNVLLGRAKTVKYNLTKVRREAFDVLEKVRSATQPDNIKQSPFAKEIAQLLPDFVSTTDDHYLKSWFAPLIVLITDWIAVFIFCSSAMYYAPVSVNC